MAFTDDQRTRIQQALNSRLVPQPKCEVCQQQKWTLAEGFVYLPLVNVSSFKPQPTEQALPCVALVCAQCGHTLLLNLITLGLRDLIEEPSKEAQPAQPAQPGAPPGT
jgi:hypothetical protein